MLKAFGMVLTFLKEIEMFSRSLKDDWEPEQTKINVIQADTGATFLILGVDQTIRNQKSL